MKKYAAVLFILCFLLTSVPALATNDGVGEEVIAHEDDVTDYSLDLAAADGGVSTYALGSGSHYINLYLAIECYSGLSSYKFSGKVDNYYFDTFDFDSFYQTCAVVVESFDSNLSWDGYIRDYNYAIVDTLDGTPTGSYYLLCTVDSSGDSDSGSGGSSSDSSRPAGELSSVIKSSFEEVFGSYEPYYDGYTISPNYGWIANAVAVLIVIYCFLRIVGGFIKC